MKKNSQTHPAFPLRSAAQRRVTKGAGSFRQIAALMATGALLSIDAARAEEPQSYLGELTSLSVGSFTTLGQAERDSRYGIAESEIVRIWPEREDGAWLYQEQAFLGETASMVDPAMKEKPYFARVVHSVEIEPGIVRRTVHRLKDPDAAKGAWRGDAPLGALSPSDVQESECAIIATRIAEKFWRAESEKCPNAYKGAAYALSLGVIVDGSYANWDRGFAADGAHVWGPATGGYIFTRKD